MFLQREFRLLKFFVLHWCGRIEFIIFGCSTIIIHIIVSKMPLKSLSAAAPGSRVSLRNASRNVLTSTVLALRVDVNDVEENVAVDENSRRLTTVEEFYAVLSDCVSFENRGELRFEVMQANLHFYNNDREKLEADKENLLKALYSGYSRSLMFENKSMTEREILVLYDDLKPLKTKESKARFKAVAKLREPIMNKLRKKYTDYVRRLFPAVMDDVIIRSSETSSSVVHASVGITGGLAKININDNCDDDDNVNDEYDSDDNVVDGGGVDNEDCDAEDEDADDDDDEAQDEDDN